VERDRAEADIREAVQQLLNMGLLVDAADTVALR